MLRCVWGGACTEKQKGGAGPAANVLPGPDLARITKPEGKRTAAENRTFGETGTIEFRLRFEFVTLSVNLKICRFPCEFPHFTLPPTRYRSALYWKTGATEEAG